MVLELDRSQWIKKPLIEVATLQRGYDLPVHQRTDGEYPVFAANGPHGTHSEAMCKGPGVVTGRSGTIGKVHFVDSDYWPLNTSLFVKDFHGNDPKWVFYMLQSFGLDRFAQGAGVPTLNRNLVHYELVDVPPLEEQKRIAAILDKADSLRRKRQQAIELADQFLRALFLDMFGDPVANPKGFSVGIIRDLVESANYGTAEKAHETEGEFPVLRMNNITYEGNWDFTSLKYVDLSEKDQPKYLARKGDVLFNRTNSKELVGKTAVFEEDRPMAIAGYLVRVRTNSLGNPYYISAYLNSVHGKKTLQNMCKSIVGMANINAQEMQNIAILLPPLELQDKFSEIAKATRGKIKMMSDISVRTDSLFNSLANDAFS
jgi:type I restriction enzyme S subunit